MRRFARALVPLLVEGSAAPRHHAIGRISRRSRGLGVADPPARAARHARAAAHRRHERLRPAARRISAASALKGALGFDAVLGTNFGPRSPGTVLTLLYRLAAEAASGTRGLAQPRGGMGALSDALAKAAVAAGVDDPHRARRCARILVEADRAAGVELESGERIAARNAWCRTPIPRPPFCSCWARAHLDTGFVRRVAAPAGPRARGEAAPGARPRAGVQRRRGSRGCAGGCSSRRRSQYLEQRLQSLEVRRVLRGAGHGDHGAHA